MSAPNSYLAQLLGVGGDYITADPLEQERELHQPQDQIQMAKDLERRARQIQDAIEVGAILFVVAGVGFIGYGIYQSRK